MDSDAMGSASKRQSVRAGRSVRNDLQVMTSAAPAAAPALGDRLRRARRVCGCSQLELASRMGVSQRHVSFVECGRSRPSLRLLVAWIDACEVLPEDRVALLEAAGFGFPAGVLKALTPAGAEPGAVDAALSALRILLHEQQDTAAYVLDSGWNILAANACGHWLGAMLTPRAADVAAGQPANLLDLLQGPDGFGRHLLNPQEVIPTMLGRAAAEAATDGGVRSALARLGAAWRGFAADAPAPAPRRQPLLMRFRTPHGDAALYSILVTFGWPLEIGAGTLRIEYLVAADAFTRALIRREGPQRG